MPTMWGVRERCVLSAKVPDERRKATTFVTVVARSPS
jgi:hypothetical protein